MPTEMVVTAVHQGGMRMVAGTGDYQVATDYPLKPGEECSGLRPLEVLLCSLAACSGSAVALLLERMHQPLGGLEVNVRATRADEHPTVLTHIALEFVVRGDGVEPGAVERALKQAEDLCPVWAMVKPGTDITSSFLLAGA